jgi:hypothetical protein
MAAFVFWFPATPSHGSGPLNISASLSWIWSRSVNRGIRRTSRDEDRSYVVIATLTDQSSALYYQCLSAD